MYHTMLFVVVYCRLNVSLSYFPSGLLRTLRYSFVKCCCCRLLFMISRFVSASKWRLHPVLDIVLRWSSRSKSTGTHSQQASLLGGYRSRRVARRCNPTHACCCGMVPRPFGTCLASSIGRCKMTIHHMAWTLPSVHSSISKPTSVMFMLNLQCNRRLTCSPKRVDLTNHKRLSVYACTNRDVFAGFFSSRRHNCGIPIATRILIANVRHIGLSNICVINLEYFKMQVWCLWNRYKATEMLNCSQYGASRLK